MRRQYPLKFGIAMGITGLVLTAYLLRDWLGPQGRAVLGVPTFLGIACLFSANLRKVDWKAVGAGLFLQVALGLLILRVPEVYELFAGIGRVIQRFLDFSDEGARFVFGPFADPSDVPKEGYAALGGSSAGFYAELRLTGRPFVFAFKVLPAVIFVSAFFSVLYHLGWLQLVVRLFAWIVARVMGTSGAETLSAVANVFMGQTEAPLIVKPYIPRMTRSELLALMIGGMATVSGGVMVAYVAMGANPVALLATSVMAAPAGLYLAKILMPETELPETKGVIRTEPASDHANVFDAAASGASEGMKLALNIAAMLIAFIAFIAMGNALLGQIDSELSFQRIFGWIFFPVAFMIGVPIPDAPIFGNLLGLKLALNEFVAFSELQTKANDLDPRTQVLAAFALTGFANFASIGIQLGGIGGLAPERRADLAQLSGRALLGGFLATLINAAIAGILWTPPIAQNVF